MSLLVKDNNKLVVCGNYASSNGLPDLSEATDAIKKIDNDYEALLSKSIGNVLCKHKMETKMLASLNHYHYEIFNGEYQVNKTSLIDYQGKKYEGYVASPQKCDKIKDELIPYKWYINDEGKLESYEYLSNDMVNAAKYRKISEEFENNIQLQKDLIECIQAIGYIKYFGVMLAYEVLNFACKVVEINDDKNRTSQNIFIYGNNNDDIGNHEVMKSLKNEPSISTSWNFICKDGETECEERNECFIGCTHNCYYHSK